MNSVSSLDRGHQLQVFPFAQQANGRRGNSQVNAGQVNTPISNWGSINVPGASTQQANSALPSSAVDISQQASINSILNGEGVRSPWLASGETNGENPEDQQQLATSLLPTDPNFNDDGKARDTILANDQLGGFWDAINSGDFSQTGSLMPDFSNLPEGVIKPIGIPDVNSIGNGTEIIGLDGNPLLKTTINGDSFLDMIPGGQDPNGMSPQLQALVDTLNEGREQGNLQTQLDFLSTMPELDPELVEEFKRLNGNGGIAELNGEANLAFAKSITNYISSALGDPTVTGEDYVAQQLEKTNPKTNPYVYETLKRVQGEVAVEKEDASNFASQADAIAQRAEELARTSSDPDVQRYAEQAREAANAAKDTSSRDTAESALNRAQSALDKALQAAGASPGTSSSSTSSPTDTSETSSSTTADPGTTEGTTSDNTTGNEDSGTPSFTRTSPDAATN